MGRPGTARQLGNLTGFSRLALATTPFSMFGVWDYEFHWGTGGVPPPATILAVLEFGFLLDELTLKMVSLATGGVVFMTRSLEPVRLCGVFELDSTRL